VNRIKQGLLWIVSSCFYLFLFIPYWIFLTMNSTIYLGELVSLFGMKTSNSHVVTNYIIGTLLTIVFCVFNVWVYRKKRVIFWALFLVHIYYSYMLLSILTHPNPIRINSITNPTD